MEVTEQDGGLRAGDDEDNEDEEQEAKHIVHLVGPASKEFLMNLGARQQLQKSWMKRLCFNHLG